MSTLTGTRQLGAYGAFGLIGTAAHYALLIALVGQAEVDPLIASSGGFILGALVNHELNRRWLFTATRRSYADTGSRFFATACFGFIVNLTLMAVLTLGLQAHYLAAQIVATGVVFLLTFAINKHWTFGR